MNDVMCRGDIRLGTACGKCSRCLQYNMASGHVDALKERRPGERLSVMNASEVAYNLQAENARLEARITQLESEARFGAATYQAARDRIAELESGRSLVHLDKLDPAQRLALSRGGSFIAEISGDWDTGWIFIDANRTGQGQGVCYAFPAGSVPW